MKKQYDARVEPDDLVVTPSGRRALVRVIDLDGFCELRYLDDGQGVTLHRCYVRRLQKGRETPPVRLEA